MRSKSNYADQTYFLNFQFTCTFFISSIRCSNLGARNFAENFRYFFFQFFNRFWFFLNAHSTTWCIVMHLCRIKTVKILTVKYTRFVFSLKIKNSKWILYVSWTERIVIFRSVELAVTLGINTFICRTFTKLRHNCIVFVVFFLFCLVCLFLFFL